MLQISTNSFLKWSVPWVNTKDDVGKVCFFKNDIRGDSDTFLYQLYLSVRHLGDRMVFKNTSFRDKLPEFEFSHTIY